jgi:hypothetical protein
MRGGKKPLLELSNSKIELEEMTNGLSPILTWAITLFKNSIKNK